LISDVKLFDGGGLFAPEPEDLESWRNFHYFYEPLAIIVLVLKEKQRGIHPQTNREKGVAIFSAGQVAKPQGLHGYG
jgi:hypothetical protein